MKVVLRVIHRSTLACLEIAFGLALLLSFGLAFFLWAFSKGPVDVTFAADYVQQALIEDGQQTTLEFDSMVAEWPSILDPLTIGISGVNIRVAGVSILKVPQLGIRLAKIPLLIGHIHPEAIIAKEPTFKLIRYKDGQYHFVLSDAEEETLQKGSAAPINLKDIGESFFKGGSLPDYPQLYPLSQLEKVSVINAKVKMVDLSTQMTWTIPQINFDLDRSDDFFVVETNYPADDATMAHARIDLRKETDTKEIILSSEVSRVDLANIARFMFPLKSLEDQHLVVNGKIDGILSDEWEIQKLTAKVSSDRGNLRLKGLYENPLSFGNLSANIQYDQQSDVFSIKDTHLLLNNRIVNLSGEKKVHDNDRIISLRFNLPEVSFSDIEMLWPNRAKNTILADWLTKKLSEGKVTDLDVTIPINMDDPALTDSRKVVGSLKFDNLKADYRAPLYPVTNARGTATLKDDVLTINVDSGHLNTLAVNKAKIEITHLTQLKDPGQVTIDTNVEGSLSTVIDYIFLPPLNLGQKVKLDPKQVKGDGNYNVHVTFPALKNLPVDQVLVTVDAVVKDLLLPKITHGLDLTGGPFKVTVDKGSVNVAGKGQIGGTPIDLDFSQYIHLQDAPYLTKINAKINAGQKIRDVFAVHLDQFIDGNVPTTIEYLGKKQGVETIKVLADLRGVPLTLGPLGYYKDADTAGTLTCDVNIVNKEIQTIKNLDIKIAKQGGATGELSFGKVGDVRDIKSGRFSSVTLGGAHQFTMDFTQTEPNVFDAKFSGQQFDARYFLKKSEKTKKQTFPQVSAHFDVSRLKTGREDDQFLSKPKLDLKINKKGEISYLDLRGVVKDGEVTVSLKPNKTGKMQLDIKSSNAGEALRVFDLYDRMIGGQLYVHGEQIAKGGLNDIAGHAKITEFTVVKAPVLAKLINLFSLSGLAELLQNKGIEFKTLKTDFEWKNTKSGQIINLKNGRTSGASIGLTFGGIINQSKGTTDLSGTVVPMSEINGFFSKIPVIGQLLTGGKNGGIIAATYSMKGPTENPSVFINPLSVLTPGFLRSFLFEGNTSSYGDEEDMTEKKKAEYNN